MMGSRADQGLLPLLRLPPLSVLLLLCLHALPDGVAAHPCEAEVGTACPERPPADLATCLKTPSEHETETTLSSECMDFVALNTACAADIKKFCDEGFFTDDTVLCLKTWTDPENLSEKCAKTLRWAAPDSDEADEEESSEGPTDELGMSDKDREEKKEWQAKRKLGRQGAIDRMKMKEADAKKEKERVDLENFKKENPEAYSEMMRQKEEDKRQAQEQKRRERMMAAAAEREKRKKAGMDDDDAPPAPGPKKGKRPSEQGKKGGKSKSYFSGIFGILFLLVLVGGGYYFFTTMGGAKSGRGGGRGGGKKKHR